MSKLKHSLFSQSTLGAILKTFSEEDFKEFEKYLNSPYANATYSDLTLFKIVKNDLDIPKETLFQNLFSEPKYDAKNLNKRIFLLFKLVQEFLVFQKIRKEKTTASSLLSKSYNERGLFNLYKKENEKIEKQLSELSIKNQDYYLQLFQLNMEIFFHPSTKKFQKEVGSLNEMSEHLDNFYMLSKLRLGGEYLSRQKIWNNQKAPFLLKEATEFATSKTDNPVFKIYAQVVKLLEQHQADPSKFEVLRADFKKNTHFFPDREKTLLLQFLINYSIYLIECGHTKFQKIQFQLFQIGIKHKYFIINEIIHDISFTNIVISGCIAKEFKKVKDFIKTHKDFLDKKLKPDAVCLGEAFLAFHEKKFEEAINKIYQVPVTSLNYKLLINSLEIRCHYEFFLLNNTEGNRSIFMTRANNFKVFINRNKTFSPAKKNSYSNLIKTLIILVKNINKAASIRKKVREDLLQRLHETSEESPNSLLPIIAKSWLLNKVKKL